MGQNMRIDGARRAMQEVVPARDLTAARPPMGPMRELQVTFEENRHGGPFIRSERINVLIDPTTPKPTLIVMSDREKLPKFMPLWFPGYPDTRVGVDHLGDAGMRTAFARLETTSREAADLKYEPHPDRRMWRYSGTYRNSFIDFRDGTSPNRSTVVRTDHPVVRRQREAAGAFLSELERFPTTTFDVWSARHTAARAAYAAQEP